MKRVNIYITQPQEDDITAMSDIMKINRSEVVRRAVTEYSGKHKEKINEFINTFNDMDEECNMEVGDPELRFLRECSKDPKFFIERAVQINTYDKGIIPFTMWDVESDLVDILHDYDALIINKSRQSGGSITNLAYMLHYSIFNENKNVIIMSNNLQQATDHLRRFKDMLFGLPKFMQLKVKINNKRTLELENGTKIMAVSGSPCSIKGLQVHYLYMDEIAWGKREDMREFISSVFPTIFSGKTYKVVLSSSPNGYNEFYQIWSDALTNYNNFKPVCIPWWAIPGRDENWKEEEIRRIGKNRFRQEYECQFIGNNILYPGQKEPQMMSFE